MGFFSWLLCSILVVALVLLLFPFSVRIEFEAGERGARALFFFFKKKVYECKKSWGKKKSGIDNTQDMSLRAEGTPERRESRPSLLGHDRAQGGGAEPHPVKSSDGSESALTETVAKKPAETPKTEPMEAPSETESGIDESEKRESSDVILSEAKDPVKSYDGNKNAQPAEVKASLVVEVSSEAKAAESENRDSEKNETPAEDKKPKKEKRKLSDREFWTIILTPDFDARAFKYILKILKAVLSLFRVRFRDCFVEGIQTDYQTMGYIAAVNGFLKAYPYVGDWDLRMDWCREKELRAAGSVWLSITLLRVFCFVLETLVLAGILAFSFWRRRARVIKTNELPELGFVRRKILNIILED